jgi:hypothetical protein
MDELAKIVELVKVLQQTVEAQSQRIDQVFKTQSEQWTAQALKLDALATGLQQGIDQLTIMDEALKKSLDESDSSLDDIAEITAGLLLLKTDMEQMKQAQTASAQ